MKPSRPSGALSPLCCSSKSGNFIKGLLLVGISLVLSMGCNDPQEILIIGHRGSPFEVVENSMAGFKLAYEHGADGVELDVQYTKDGRVIIMHDERLDRTTTCQGEVAQYTVEQLSDCRLTNGEPILQLKDALGDLTAWFEIVFVEIKLPEEKIPEAHVITALTDEVIDTVLASNRTEELVIISYDKPVMLRLVERQDEGFIAGWDDSEGESVAQAKRYDLPWALMPVRSIDSTLGAVARGLGQQVAVYQVNSPAQFLEAEAADVRAIMADSINTICALLGRRPKDLPAKK